MLNQLYVDNIIKTALCEDINYIDVTTDNLLDDDHKSNAYFVKVSCIFGENLCICHNITSVCKSITSIPYSDIHALFQ